LKKPAKPSGGMIIFIMFLAKPEISDTDYDRLLKRLEASKNNSGTHQP